MRQVLDRFRADDCSVPDAAALRVRISSASTRIDVGHEALLRRWEKVSGRGAELGLAARRTAGRRALSRLACDRPMATRPCRRIWSTSALAWWNARPRTAAWARALWWRFRPRRALLQVNRCGSSAGKRWRRGRGLRHRCRHCHLPWPGSRQSAERAQTAARSQSFRRNAAQRHPVTSIFGRARLPQRFSARLSAEKCRAAARRREVDAGRSCQATKTRPPEISAIEVLLLLGFSDVASHRAIMTMRSSGAAERAAADLGAAAQARSPQSGLMRQIHAASSTHR